ncbi:alanine--tRNA ligase, partial [Candidatus Berkelbacteria bacterium]|nr:alanine--tRNA ligase [Candidatus Berkelbacteria bacterium]
MNTLTVFETDELKAVLTKIPEGDIRSRRIITDHVRAINGLIKDGVAPSNKAQGAVLRRLIRRAFTHVRLIGADDGLVASLVENHARAVVEGEVKKFSQTLKQAMGIFSRILKNSRKEISGQDAFLLKESYGLPVELAQALARKYGYSIDMDGFRLYEVKHAEASATSSPVKFKGGLVEITPETTKLHTAHHLLLAALRKVLGAHVVQRGSNITSERLRIDVSHSDPLTPEEIAQVEHLVNDWIEQDLPITREEMSLDEAYKKGALGEFGATYPERVSVYSIGPHSIEICGGPHV